MRVSSLFSEEYGFSFDRDYSAIPFVMCGKTHTLQKEMLPVFSPDPDLETVQ